MWIASAATLLFLALSIRPPLGSETRYIEASREMAEGGDWIVPHLAGVPYFEKPVLVYWAGALTQAVLGLGEMTARLPSIVASVASLVVTYQFARELRGSRFGLAAAGLLLASGLFLVMGSVLTADPLFSAWLALSWWAFWRHHRAPAGRWIWLFWTALGLAVLTKGPLALALTAASLGSYLALTRRLRDVRSMRLVRGTAVVALVNLPWHVLTWARDPRLLEFFYVRQNLRAFADGRINHDGPVWYYLPVVVAAAFPWSALVVAALPSAVVGAFRQAAPGSPLREPADRRASLRLYLTCVAVSGLVLLSAAGSKLATYLLPLLPAVAILVADWVARQARGPGKALRFAVTVQAAVLLGVAAVLPCFAAEIAARVPGLDAVRASVACGAVALVALAAAVGARLVRTGWVAKGFVVVGAAWTAAVVVLDTAAFALVPELTAQSLVARVAPEIAPEDGVVVASRIAEDYTVSIALRRRFAVLGPARELGMGHFVELRPPPAAVPQMPYAIDRTALPESEWLLDMDELVRRWNGPRRVWLIARSKEVDELRRRAVSFDIDGDGRRLVVSNHPRR